jgi:4-hydroxy-tetrahydrodipicolinate reductase
MGGALIRCAANEDGVSVRAAIENPEHPSVGRDAGGQAGLEALGIAISGDLSAANDADVLIDFTFHEAVVLHVEFAVENGKGIVIGTTGLSEAEGQKVRDAATQIPVLWAANMSLGVNVLSVLAEKAAAALGLEYDAEIVEIHHRHKVDSPSGTALLLGKSVADGRNQDFAAVACYGREGFVGERPQGEIGIHALRVGDVVGDHTLTLGSECERIELTHRATSRDAFANGALRAACWLSGRDAGLYDMKDVLGLT